MNFVKTLAVIWTLCLLQDHCRASVLDPAPPGKGEQIAYAHLKRSVPSFLETPLKELRLSNPHRSYFLDLNGIANGQLLSEVGLFSWHYFVFRGEKAVAEIHLNANQTTGPLLTVLSISEGPLVRSAFEALKEAGKLPQVKAMDYEPRLLTAPAVSFYAVWLHGKSNDILIPLDPVGLLPKGLVPNRAHSEAEVIKVLRPIAQETIEAFREAGPNAVG